MVRHPDRALTRHSTSRLRASPRSGTSRFARRRRCRRARRRPGPASPGDREPVAAAGSLDPSGRRGQGPRETGKRPVEPVHPGQERQEQWHGAAARKGQAAGVGQGLCVSHARDGPAGKGTPQICRGRRRVSPEPGPHPGQNMLGRIPVALRQVGPAKGGRLRGATEAAGRCRGPSGCLGGQTTSRGRLSDVARDPGESPYTGDTTNDVAADGVDESWKEDRLDVAEHMYGKTHALRQSLQVPSAEVLADTLQHIGADLSSKGNHTLALQWFKRAHDLINAQSLEQLSAHGLELRLAICHGRVQSLLALGSAASLQEASNLVAYVESEMGDKPVVLHWRLEILRKSPGEVFDAEACTSILRRMIRCFDRSDETFRFLLHQIKELRDKSERLACGLLDEFMRLHVLRSANVAWINKVVVKRISMATAQADDEASLKTLHGLMENAHDALSGPLKTDAAGAVHSVSGHLVVEAETDLLGVARMEKGRSAFRHPAVCHGRCVVRACASPAVRQRR